MSRDSVQFVEYPRRVKRVQIHDRTVTEDVSVGELEARIATCVARHNIEHDLTSADTKAFPPPPYFLEAASRAISDGRPGYTPVRGDLAVREALAPRLEAMLGIPVDPTSDILLTAGTQAGLFAATSTLVETGSSVLVPDPEYLCDERAVRFLGASVVRVPFVRMGSAARLDLDAVAQGLRDGARVLVFSNPHNPTGSVMSPDSLRALAELVVEAGAWVISDELYSRFIFDDLPATHIASMPGMRDRCVTCLGPSKTESASGFRVGVMVGPPELLNMVASVVEITTLRAPAYAQYALEHWLRDDCDLVNEYVARCQRLRDIAVHRLARVDGVSIHSPPATAWLFPDISGLGRSEQEVVEALIKVGILVRPGAYFGPAGVGCVRLSFAQAEEAWPRVVDKVAEVLGDLAH